MAYNREAQSKAIAEGTAPKYQFLNIPMVHHTFGHALASFDPYVNFTVTGIVQKLLCNFESFEQPWRNYCAERGFSVAAGYHEATRDDDGAWSLQYEQEEEVFEDDHRRIEWLRGQVCDRIADVTAEIQEKANTPGTEAYKERDTYPLVGIFAKGKNYIVPLTRLVGFCPQCLEPLMEKDFYANGTKMNCPACVEIGKVDEIEAKHRRNFDVMPYSDILVEDAVADLQESLPTAAVHH